MADSFDEPRRSSDNRDYDRDEAPRERSRHHRERSRSRTRSPAPRSSHHHRERSRSRSPRRSRSPVRKMDTDAPRDSRSDRDHRDHRDSRDARDSHRDSRASDRYADRGDRDSRPAFDPARKAINREYAATEAAKKSRKECRVYVGNLAFGVKWNDLKDFMREAGNVVFSEIMMLPNGMSKGCGVVEFSQPEEAQKAIRDLSDQQLLGRPVFVREDREDDARYGSAAISGRAGYMGPGAFPGGGAPGGYMGGRGGFGGGFRGGFAGGVGHHHGGAAGFGGPVAAAAGQGRHLYIQGLPFTVGWQDLKDLFRAAGNIIRADVKIGPDGSHSGTGTVVYETAQDAQNAIAMYNGFEFQGNLLEVREDRFPTGHMGGGAGFMGRGGFAGRGGFGGFGGRGGFGGGFGGAYGGFGPGAFAGAGGFPGAAGFPAGPGFHHEPRVIAPSTQIFVRNLPWSTSNEDLVELFQTTGTVEQAEVLYEHGRSKGSGVVQFASVEEAETAISKFSGYSYGGRPLAIEYNARYRDFNAVQGSGGVGAPSAPAADVMAAE